MSGASELPTLRWGIVGCGLISSWFVSDLVLDRLSPPMIHKIVAVGSSSRSKGEAFIAQHAPSATPAIYDSYEGVYKDPNVDIVYIGTPHSLHVKNAMGAINAGKHVLCEKPFTINAKETELILDAAKKKGVFLMEAVWTRFFPIASALQKLVHIDEVIGDVSRVFVDFSLDMPIASLPENARTRDISLGAGALLDIGMYAVTWASIILDQHPENNTEKVDVSSTMTINEGVDEVTTILLNYRALRAQAILTASMLSKGPEEFCRIEGSKGSIYIGGAAASKPAFLVIKIKDQAEKRIDFDVPGWGFHYEADAVANDIKEGNVENATMPWAESLRVMRLMDKVRGANGLMYPQDS
ncbi:hypothetical protein BJ875DRAFT_454414 [Amylocarpus encephaloides]|uniref:D-xylose 1-dehydrogenase (NADP(+), D-xylono-1,5-lactone-forming) n=1 Tax=Amylocarpus encephaloides TaxID=45428 RepID=A0A9P7YP96_9HELO|nr:hypothetical protein BJ875DRAFT_454414 [Amylocarpus encephaloides]